MTRLFKYLDDRRLGIYSSNETPVIDGLNDIILKLQRACRATDRKAALTEYCRNYAWKSIDNEDGYSLIHIIIPRSDPSLLPNWIEIANAGYGNYMRDHIATIYVNVENGQIYDNFLNDFCPDIETYLNERRKWWKAHPVKHI